MFYKVSYWFFELEQEVSNMLSLLVFLFFLFPFFPYFYINLFFQNSKPFFLKRKFKLLYDSKLDDRNGQQIQNKNVGLL